MTSQALEDVKVQLHIAAEMLDHKAQELDALVADLRVHIVELREAIREHTASED